MEWIRLKFKLYMAVFVRVILCYAVGKVGEKERRKIRIANTHDFQSKLNQSLRVCDVKLCVGYGIFNASRMCYGKYIFHHVSFSLGVCARRAYKLNWNSA